MHTYQARLFNKLHPCAFCRLENFSEETLKENVQIPWRMIRAMRNVFAHSYDRADPELAWQTITQDVPVLKEQLLTILKKTDSDGNNDRNDFSPAIKKTKNPEPDGIR